MSSSFQFSSRPGPLLRLLFRLPVALYRLRLGWLLGHRFLMVAHRGRRTGRVRHTVLEVIRYDPDTGESVVTVIYGQRADWYRNLQASPALEICTGRERYTPAQRFLTRDEVYREFVEYERRHPRTVRTLFRFLGPFVGFHYDGTEAQRQALAGYLHMVAFHPKRPEE